MNSYIQEIRRRWPKTARLFAPFMENYIENIWFRTRFAARKQAADMWNVSIDQCMRGYPNELQEIEDTVDDFIMSGARICPTYAEYRWFSRLFKIIAYNYGIWSICHGQYGAIEWDFMRDADKFASRYMPHIVVSRSALPIPIRDAICDAIAGYAFFCQKF